MARKRQQLPLVLGPVPMPSEVAAIYERAARYAQKDHAGERGNASVAARDRDALLTLLHIAENDRGRFDEVMGRVGLWLIGAVDVEGP